MSRKIDFGCECENGCNETISLTIDEYVAATLEPGIYIVSDNCPNRSAVASRIVEQRTGYALYRAEDKNENARL